MKKRYINELLWHIIRRDIYMNYYHRYMSLGVSGGTTRSQTMI
jgi:hypothetical protein